MPFSAFARGQFPKILNGLSDERDKEVGEEVVRGFERYENLTREEREMLVRDAGKMVDRFVSVMNISRSATTTTTRRRRRGTPCLSSTTRRLRTYWAGAARPVR